jgi:hypothetical protein
LRERNLERLVHQQCRTCTSIVSALGLGMLLLTTACGCGESKPPLLPVSGKVTIDGKPAEEGGVVFHNGLQQLIGSIQPDGAYSIRSNKDAGAPLGKYKVTVMVTMTPKNAQGQPVNLPKTLSNKKFMSPKTTPLEVEVVESPGANAYDLAVTR